jgi:fructoselysine-6-P-deglycase FrlB-like protein
MSEIVQEIAGQPVAWAEAVRRAPEFAAALPAHGQRVAVVGCGTSLYIAQAIAGIREASGLGETDAFPASEAPIDRRYDAWLAISRSGTTTEVVRLLESLPKDAVTIAVSAVDATPVALAASRSIVIDFADELSVVQTRFATTTLALLRAHLGEDLTPAIAQAEEALGADLPVDPSAIEQWVFLGRGWTIGLASEAALKMREATGSWAESYPAMEFRHGPISAAGARSVVWMLGTEDAGLERDVAATGATVVARRLDPMAELVTIQRTAVALAEARGLDPDHPRHLTRSVVLS